MHRWQLEWLVPGLGLILFLPGMSVPTQEVERVRVMTYNIHHGEAVDGQLDLQGIADVIRQHDADIVGLQEVDRHWSARSAFADQVEELASRLDMYAFFGPIYDLSPEEAGRPRRQYGLAILSRFPITAERNFELTRLPSTGENPRRVLLPGFPMVTLNVNGTPLHVFNTHLDYRSDSALRHVQVAEMLELIAQTEGPKVLMGDFNALPDAAEMRPLKEVFVDAWDVRGQGAGYTFPTDVPIKRIDDIFVTPGIEVDSVSVLETTASDHRPVIADLTLPRGK